MQQAAGETTILPYHLLWPLRNRIATFILVTISTSLLLDSARADTIAAKDRVPNIVLILADDMGYSDLGCYGGEIRTPRIDRLAAGGLRFSQFYNNALCGPTRASLMTGLFSQAAGVQGWTGSLNDRCATIPEVLKQAGYFTLATGRLDMTTSGEWYVPRKAARHIDRFFGSGGQPGHYGPGHYSKPVRTGHFFCNGEEYAFPADATYYKTDLFTDYAVKFIEEASRQDKPFFLYVAHSAPHWPLQAKESDIAKYREMYLKTGWDRLRSERHRRLIDEGLIDESCRLSPRDPSVPSWDDAEHKAWEAERMAVYAAQVDCLDQNVGRLLDAMDRTGTRENTLIMFLSDNGASEQAWGRALDKPGKPWRLDGTPTEVGNKPKIMPGPDTFVTGGVPWANVSNTPFRGYKAACYEGGIATPLIVSWPGVIRRGGKITHQPGHIVDIMATCLDVACAEYPKQFLGRDLLPLAGRSLRPVFEGKTREEHDLLCWNVSGSRAVRMGHWKLVAGKKQKWQLHDLAADRMEMTNLAEEHPDRVKEMSNVYTKWEKVVGISP